MNHFKKAIHYLAKAEALSNAAEFIRGHGEEGCSFEDKIFDKGYKKEAEILYKQLEARATKYYQKYKDLGIEIDTEVDQNY